MKAASASCVPIGCCSRVFQRLPVANTNACVQVGKIGGLDAYFAEPKSTPKAGVMLIHDIHGWDKKNVRLVADKYADAGVPLVTTFIRYSHL